MSCVLSRCSFLLSFWVRVQVLGCIAKLADCILPSMICVKNAHSRLPKRRTDDKYKTFVSNRSSTQFLRRLYTFSVFVSLFAGIDQLGFPAPSQWSRRHHE